MFMPNYNIVNRFASARVNGCKDEQFENMMRNQNNVMNLKRNYYDSAPRLENCVSEIIEEPNTITNINTFGDKNNYNNVMTNNLNNNNFTSVGNNEITQTKNNKENYTPTNDFRYQYLPSNDNEYYEPPSYVNNNCINNDNFLNRSYVINNKQLILIILSISCIFGFILAIGLIYYKNKQLKIKIEEIETNLNNDNNKQYIYIPTQQYPYNKNFDSMNEYKNNNYNYSQNNNNNNFNNNNYNQNNFNNNDNNYNLHKTAVSPMVPIDVL